MLVVLWNLVHLIVGGLSLGFGVGFIVLALFGFVALVYVIPLAIIAHRRGRSARVRQIDRCPTRNDRGHVQPRSHDVGRSLWCQ
jgi:hypothetical protein